MSNQPFMQFYVADYLVDTQHLTTEQHGAYLLLLMTMWHNAGSLPNDEKKLARIARVTLKRWHIIADSVMEFFEIEDDTITQKRLVEEYQKAVSKSEKRKTSGSLGGKAKSLKNNKSGLANASDLPEHLSEPDIRIEKDTSHDVSKKAGRKVGCRLPEDWQPTPELVEYGMKDGLPEDRVWREVERFKNYWAASSGRNAVKLDWNRAWQNWVMGAADKYLQNKKSTSNLSREDAAEAYLYAQLQ